VDIPGVAGEGGGKGAAVPDGEEVEVILDGDAGVGIAGRESWSAVSAAGVRVMAPLASAAGTGVIAPLALGSCCRWQRGRRLASGAWLEARD
jgi:hypothetical protein